MDDSELRLECLKMANSGLRDAGRPDKEPFELAERLYSWVRYGKQKPQEPIAKCVGRDGNVEPEIAAKLFGAEPSVGNEPMKETHFKDYKPE